MKIAIIGNSYVGALKRAWDAWLGHRPANLTFFAHRGKGIDDLRPDGRRLVAGNAELEAAMAFTSGGLTAIEPDTFDAVLIHGMGAQPFFRDGGFYSTAVLRRAMDDVATTTRSYRLLSMVRTIYDGPCHVAHNPLPAARQVHDHATPVAYLEGMTMLNRHIFRPLGAEMIGQPDATICNGENTLPDYAIGSKRLPIGADNDDDLHPAGNPGHMNEAFGALWLDYYFSRIGIA